MLDLELEVLCGRRVYRSCSRLSVRLKNTRPIRLHIFALCTSMTRWSWLLWLAVDWIMPAIPKLVEHRVAPTR